MSTSTADTRASGKLRHRGNPRLARSIPPFKGRVKRSVAAIRCFAAYRGRRNGGVFQRIKTFELSAERKLRLRDLPSHKVVRVYFPAPFEVTVCKVETLQMRCGFDPHISRVKLVGFALGRHEFQSNDSKSSFRQR